ncbi:MAG: hypothetical protein ACTHME_01435 [Candidatus Nitrosocosmicus sp.]
MENIKFRLMDEARGTLEPANSYLHHHLHSSFEKTQIERTMQYKR